MNRLLRIGGLTSVTVPITITTITWKDPSPFSLSPPVTPAIKMIYASAPPASVSATNPLVGIGSVPCTDGTGAKGVRYINYYADGTTSFATACIISTALNI